MENNTQPVTAQELPNVAMHSRTGFPSEEDESVLFTTD